MLALILNQIKKRMLADSVFLYLILADNDCHEY